ncbi:MAG: DUF4062 domain-containing protein [Acidimicrobiaceae bacterium]|nr:DUF4062 domain-containing protein [Acidimicrobiaceae bacterium]MXZ64390.1 DUF4062 domain-containing protein [Acidimicrobiaceae bacterium]MYF33853.1 DUF4062 domain-containing protein [Acidimicrobiaceae bacterium]MYG76801.1 DUF4062 domain-containing protein [Acidimicrobiaceae bacterium]MYJ84154.1 DUF4062 domain-containing protein [Acidimicrobiaceae bacterium]
MEADNGAMKVFVSSPVRGYEDLRDAARAAIGVLGYEPVLAEDFDASAPSPRATCLAAVREADAVVLILGAEYGPRQASSNLSATHEEYREAKKSGPVLAFVQACDVRSEEQTAFVHEVRNWEQGHYTASFRDASDLRDKVIRGLHRHFLDGASTPVDEDRLVERARSLAVDDGATGSANLVVVVTGDSPYTVVRPTQLRDQQLHNFLLSEALTGADAVLDVSAGSEPQVRSDAIVLTQRNGGRSVELHEDGSIVVVQPALRERSWQSSSLPSIIEEDVIERIARVVRLAGRVLDHVDDPPRISQVAVVAALCRPGSWPWRTRAEEAASPNSATMRMFGPDRVEALLSPPVRRRAALLHDADGLAKDLATRLGLQLAEAW